MRMHIFTLLLFIISIFAQLSNAQNYTFPLSIGDKWFYKYYSSSPYRDTVYGYITREIIDTTDIGVRVVNVNYYYSPHMWTNRNETEYWYFHLGNLFLSRVYIDTLDPPMFITSLNKDSIKGDYSWHIEQINAFGKERYSQICSVYIDEGRNGWYYNKYRITDGLGLTNLSYFRQTDIVDPSDTTFLVGFKIKGIFIGDSSNTIVSVENNNLTIDNFTLRQNYPNPFNPTTVISYYLPSNTYVSLKVYNILGEEVVRLVNGMQMKGEHKLLFDAYQLSAGIYFYKIQIPNNIQIRKCVYIK